MNRAQAAGVFSRGRNTIDIRTGGLSQQFRSLQRQLRSGNTTIERMEARDMVVGDGTTSAGLFGTEGFIPLIERAMLYYGPMLQLCTVIATTDGRNTNMPTVDDTANEADVVGEAADVSATQDPSIGNKEWETVKLRSKKVKYSAESAEDSVFDLFALLTDLLGERLGRGANKVWTLGSTTKVDELWRLHLLALQRPRLVLRPTTRWPRRLSNCTSASMRRTELLVAASCVMTRIWLVSRS